MKTLEGLIGKIPCKVHFSHGSLYIEAQGFGDKTSEDGSGTPLMVTTSPLDGLEVVIWNNINQEDSSHIISLDGARETFRE